jgi:hypothetical protein
MSVISCVVRVIKNIRYTVMSVISCVVSVWEMFMNVHEHEDEGISPRSVEVMSSQ